jgi:hypothetical protein
MAADVNDTGLIERIEFVDQREKEYFAKAQLGEQVRLFLASPAGRYLHGRARLDFEAAKSEAIDVSPDSYFGRRKLRRLQQKAALASQFMSYLADALVEGEHAARELDEYRK